MFVPILTIICVLFIGMIGGGALGKIDGLLEFGALGFAVVVSIGIASLVP